MFAEKLKSVTDRRPIRIAIIVTGHPAPVQTWWTDAFVRSCRPTFDVFAHLWAYDENHIKADPQRCLDGLSPVAHLVEDESIDPSILLRDLGSRNSHGSYTCLHDDKPPALLDRAHYLYALMRAMELRRKHEFTTGERFDVCMHIGTKRAAASNCRAYPYPELDTLYAEYSRSEHGRAAMSHDLFYADTATFDRVAYAYRLMPFIRESAFTVPINADVLLRYAGQMLNLREKAI